MESHFFTSLHPFPEQLKNIREEYVNDPRRIALMIELERIIQEAPIVQRVITQHGIKDKYPYFVQRKIDGIKDLLKDIEREYSNRLMHI